MHMFLARTLMLLPGEAVHMFRNSLITRQPNVILEFGLHYPHQILFLSYALCNVFGMLLINMK